MVIAAVAGGLCVEPQVMLVADMERSQPAAHRHIFVAVQLQFLVKSSDDLYNVSGQHVPSPHGVGEVVRTHRPMSLRPSPSSLGEGVAYEIPPIKVGGTVETAQGGVQERYANIRVVIRLEEVVKLEIALGPQEASEDLGSEVGVGLLVVWEEEEVVKHGRL